MLSAEQVLDAVSQATGVPERFKGYPLGTRAIELAGGLFDLGKIPAVGDCCHSRNALICPILQSRFSKGGYPLNAALFRGF